MHNLQTIPPARSKLSFFNIHACDPFSSMVFHSLRDRNRTAFALRYEPHPYFLKMHIHEKTSGPRIIKNANESVTRFARLKDKLRETINIIQCKVKTSIPTRCSNVFRHCVSNIIFANINVHYYDFS